MPTVAENKLTLSNLLEDAADFADAMNTNATITPRTGAAFSSVPKLIADKGADLDAETANAARWAAEDEDVVVSGGLFSAFHYSRKAAASAASVREYNLGSFVDDAAAEAFATANGTLAAGDEYFNTTVDRKRVYDGTNWYEPGAPEVTVSIANGGTNATTAAGARASLGVGFVAAPSALDTITPDASVFITPVQSVTSIRGAIGVFYNANDLTDFYYDGESKAAVDNTNTALPDGVTANDEGRFKRANALPEGGDSPLPLAKHLKYAYNQGAKNRNARSTKDQAVAALPVFNGFRADTSTPSGDMDLYDFYANVIPFETETFDTIAAWDATADPYIFTVPRTAYGELEAYLPLSATAATAGDVFAEIVKLGATTTPVTGGNLRATVSGNNWRYIKTSHGMGDYDLFRMSLVNAYGTTPTTFDDKFSVVPVSPGANGYAVPGTNFGIPSGAPTNTGDSITPTAVTASFGLTVPGNDYVVGDYAYLANIPNVSDGWYAVGAIDSPSTDDIVFNGAVCSGAFTSGEAVTPHRADVTLTPYGTDSALANRTAIARDYKEGTALGTSAAFSLNPKTGARVFTEDETYAVFVSGPSGIGLAVPQKFGFVPSGYLQYKEFGGIAIPEDALPDYGRNLAIPQGDLAELYKTVEDAIDDLSRFSAVCLSGTASVVDKGVYDQLPTFYDTYWVSDTSDSLGRNGLASTKYIHQRTLVDGIRAKNEQCLIFGYVAMSSDAPKGTQAGQGDFNTSSSTISMGLRGSQTDATRTISGIAASGDELHVTTTVALPNGADGNTGGSTFADGDWFFIDDAGGVTELDNTGWRFINTSGTTYAAIEGDSVSAAEQTITGISAGSFDLTGHGYPVSGDNRAYVGNVTGLADGIYQVQWVSADKFTLNYATNVGIIAVTPGNDGATLTVFETNGAHGLTVGDGVFLYEVYDDGDVVTGFKTVAAVPSDVTFTLTGVNSSTNTITFRSRLTAGRAGGNAVSMSGMSVGGSSFVGPAYVHPHDLTSYNTGGTIRNYWTTSAVPIVKQWINLWREDDVDGIFFDLANAPWVQPEVFDLVAKECKKFGLRCMFNVTAPNASGLNTLFVLDSDYPDGNDYIFYEGAGGSKAAAGAASGATGDSETNTLAAMAKIDADPRRIGAAMLFTEADYDGSAISTRTVSSGIASIAVDAGTGETTINFDTAHPYSNGDKIRFNRIRDTYNNDIENLVGINFTVEQSASTSLVLTGLDGRTLTTYSKANTDAVLGRVDIVVDFVDTGTMFTDFRDNIVATRPTKDLAGAMASGLGLYNKATPYYRSDWSGQGT